MSDRNIFEELKCGIEEIQLHQEGKQSFKTKTLERKMGRASFGFNRSSRGRVIGTRRVETRENAVLFYSKI